MNSKIIAFPARKPLRKVVLNTETTGLYPDDGHRIVELSAIELNGQEITQNRFHRYFNPEKEVDEGAAEVHGWTLEKLQDKPKFAEFANQVAEFIRDAELIVHNAQFDVSFLNSEFERVGLPPVESICKKITDTLMIARELYPEEKNNLNALCERYEVDDSHLITRGALLDAELIAEVYLRMINGEHSSMKPLGGILAGTDQIIDQYLLGIKNSDSSEGSYRHKEDVSKLNHYFDAEEMLRALVKQIRKNLNERDEKLIGNSSENWREGGKHIKDNLSAHNTSKEILLERNIAQFLKKEFGDDSHWWNQMPIASGLVKATADRRRAIDLVHRHDPDGKRYDFVELKIESDTPIIALMEILRYGLVYLVLRKKRDWLPEASREQPVFNAAHVGLCVLAPKSYYDNFKFDLSWLQDKINNALAQIINEPQLDLILKMEINSYWPVQLEKWDKEILERPKSILRDWKPAYPL